AEILFMMLHKNPVKLDYTIEGTYSLRCHLEGIGLFLDNQLRADAVSNQTKSDSFTKPASTTLILTAKALRFLPGMLVGAVYRFLYCIRGSGTTDNNDEPHISLQLGNDCHVEFAWINGITELNHSQTAHVDLFGRTLNPAEQKIDEKSVELLKMTWMTM